MGLMSDGGDKQARGEWRRGEGSAVEAEAHTRVEGALGQQCTYVIDVFFL
jgi:hypothetical protein